MVQNANVRLAMGAGKVGGASAHKVAIDARVGARRSIGTGRRLTRSRQKRFAVSTRVRLEANADKAEDVFAAGGAVDTGTRVALGRHKGLAQVAVVRFEADAEKKAAGALVDARTAIAARRRLARERQGRLAGGAGEERRTRTDVVGAHSLVGARCAILARIGRARQRHDNVAKGTCEALRADTRKVIGRVDANTAILTG